MSDDDTEPRAVGRLSRGATLAVRILLGAFFVGAGLLKLQDIRLFAFAVKAFELGLTDDLTATLAYAVPWMEILAGAALLSGFWSRSGGLAVTLMMLAFIGGILSLQLRGLDVECPCFGTLTLFCEGPLGPCHLARNTVLALLGLVVAWRW